MNEQGLKEREEQEKINREQIKEMESEIHKITAQQQNIHLVLALDDSGSMGRYWQYLVKTVQ